MAAPTEGTAETATEGSMHTVQKVRPRGRRPDTSGGARASRRSENDGSRLARVALRLFTSPDLLPNPAEVGEPPSDPERPFVREGRTAKSA